MKDGKISESGSYIQLMKRDGPFAQFLLSHFKEDSFYDNPSEDQDGTRLFTYVQHLVFDIDMSFQYKE